MKCNICGFEDKENSKKCKNCNNSLRENYDKLDIVYELSKDSIVYNKWFFLGIFFPVIGLIVFIVWACKKNRKNLIGFDMLKGAALGFFFYAIIFYFVYGLVISKDNNIDSCETKCAGYDYNFISPNKCECIKTSTTEEIESFINDVNSYETVICVLSINDCMNCDMYKQVLNKYSNDNNFRLYWFNVDEINNRNIELLTNTNIVKNNNVYPTTYIIKKKEVVSEIIGYKSEEETYNFLLENDVIK